MCVRFAVITKLPVAPITTNVRSGFAGRARGFVMSPSAPGCALHHDPDMDSISTRANTTTATTTGACLRTRGITAMMTWFVSERRWSWS